MAGDMEGGYIHSKLVQEDMEGKGERHGDTMVDDTSE